MILFEDCSKIFKMLKLLLNILDMNVFNHLSMFKALNSLLNILEEVD